MAICGADDVASATIIVVGRDVDATPVTVPLVITLAKAARVKALLILATDTATAATIVRINLRVDAVDAGRIIGNRTARLIARAGPIAALRRRVSGLVLPFASPASLPVPVAATFPLAFLPLGLAQPRRRSKDEPRRKRSGCTKQSPPRGVKAQPSKELIKPV
jgi:hypothetical protein